MVFLKALLFTLALGTEALARDSSKINCVTEYATKSVKPVRSYTSTKTETITEIKRIFKRKDVTITPKPTTVTIGSTVYITTTETAETETDTATTTLINTSTETDTITSTQTQTDTITVTTTSTSTSTIPTPTDGWFPFDENPDFVARRSLEIGAKRGSKSDPQGISCDSGKVKFGHSVYPQRVDCLKTILKTTTKTVTSTIPGRTITIGTSTAMVTTTGTEIITSTVYPDDVTSTVTVETDTTITVTTNTDTTTTTTATATVQSVVPTTYYEACSSDNLINHANGGYIDSLWPNGNTLLFLTGTTPYACCVTCLTTDLCIGSYQFGTACYGVKGSTCSAGQASSAYYTTKTGSGTGAYLSNGRCGYFRNGA